MNDGRKYDISSKAVLQRQEAAKKHGIHAFENRGEEALDPAKINRLSKLRRLLAEEPGRNEYRLELTARMALICELGFSHLRAKAEAGEDIWESGVIRRLAGYVAETRRLLESCDDEIPKDSSNELIAQMLKGDRGSS